MPILRPEPPRPHPDRERAALVLRNVRPVERSAAAGRGTVDPVLTGIARTRPGTTSATIDGRPVVIYIERDRVRWARTIGVCVGIAAPIAGVLAAAVYAVGAVIGWLFANMALILGVIAVVVIVGFIVRALTRAGICCPGLHCSGCGHR